MDASYSKKISLPELHYIAIIIVIRIEVFIYLLLLVLPHITSFFFFF